MPDDEDVQLSIDVRDIAQAADDMGYAVDQVPFAAAKMLNYGARLARAEMIENTWPRSVTQRNATFLRGAAFGYGAMKWATKNDLTVEMRDISGRANLAAHAEGGVIKPLKRSHLAIPVKSWVRRGAHGVVKGMTPSDMLAKKNVVLLAKGIFERIGNRLHLRYSFKSEAQQPADVPFYETWERQMNFAFNELFDDVFKAAMRTRR